MYIAELLLRLTNDLTPDVFFRRIQAGFSLTMREPRHSVCGCTQPGAVCNSPYISALNTQVDNQTGASGSNVTRFSFNQTCANAWGLFALDRDCRAAQFGINLVPGCPLLEFMEDDMLECNSSTTPQESYQVDGLASNILKVYIIASQS